MSSFTEVPPQSIQQKKGVKAHDRSHRDKSSRRKEGSAKKGGAGGKFTWGRAGDEYEDLPIDVNDPNYSEDEGAESSVVVAETVSSITLPEFKRQSHDIVVEYFECEDVEEVATCLGEMAADVFHFEFVKRALTISMDFKDRERELVSRLLPGLCGGALLRSQICKGFERVLESLEDLQVDIPDAPKMVTNFLARAVVDEVVPPSFLADPLIMSLGGDVVEQAKVLLSLKHGMSRLARVWGPGDGRPVKALKEEVALLLGELMLSKDCEEAVRCVRGMNSPSFHHEVVKRAIYLTADKEDGDRAAMSAFLTFACKQDAISPQQMEKGFRRVVAAVPDLVLDAPHARAYVDGFIKRAVADAVLPESWLSVDVLSPAAPAPAAEEAAAPVAAPDAAAATEEGAAAAEE